MRRPAWPFVLAMLLLIAPLAAAQSGALRLDLEPASGTVAPGGNATARLVVTNADLLRPMIVRLWASGDADVSIEPAQVQLLPGQTATANATLTARGNATGTRSIVFTASDAATNQSATRTYLLTVEAPAPGPGPDSDSDPAPGSKPSPPPSPSPAPSPAPGPGPQAPGPHPAPAPPPAPDVSGAPRGLPPTPGRGVVVAAEAPPSAVHTARIERSADAAPWAVVGCAAVGGASLAVAWLRRRHPELFLALYSRLAPALVVGEPTRAAILRLVAAEPGIACADAQRRLGLANGRMAHHVRVLERARCLRVVADGARRRLYPADAPRVAPVPPLSERVLASLAGRGEVTRHDLARELGVSRQALDHHLRRHAAQGRVVVGPRVVSLRR